MGRSATGKKILIYLYTHLFNDTLHTPFDIEVMNNELGNTEMEAVANPDPEIRIIRKLRTLFSPSSIFIEEIKVYYSSIIQCCDLNNQ